MDSIRYFQGIAQVNVDEMKNILQVNLVWSINKVFQKITDTVCFYNENTIISGTDCTELKSQSKYV